MVTSLTKENKLLRKALSKKNEAESNEPKKEEIEVQAIDINQAINPEHLSDSELDNEPENPESEVNDCLKKAKVKKQNQEEQEIDGDGLL